MGKRILIVGGVAGGASVAARARRIDEAAEIIMFERGPHVSFSNCSLPFYLSGMVEQSDDLIMISPEEFKSQYNIEARINSEVVKINRENKTITVRKTDTDEKYDEKYDQLVLSPGALALCPAAIKGSRDPNVFTIRNVVDISKLQDYITANKIDDIAVIGGGFIGVEVAENLRLAGKNVSLIEAMDQIMMPLDYDMAQILHKEMHDKGVNLILGDSVKAVYPDRVELSSGREVAVKVVVMAIGVRPDVALATEAGLELGESGGIKVDHNYLTNDKNIYAVGDAIEVHHKLTGHKTKLALAGPAQRQARAVAEHIYGIPHNNNGVIGTSVVGVFDLAAASTGLNEKTAAAAGYDYNFVYLIPNDKVGLMPDANPMHFKLIYEVPTGKILGAQAIGKGNVDKRIDVIATMLAMGGTLEDLKELELCYAPFFSTAKDVVNLAAIVGLNILYGRFRQVPVSKVRELVENDEFIIDVREKNEFETGHLRNSVNIPLSELRNRLDEIPRDRAVYLHCRSSQRSYNAVMTLQNLGFDNVINISGSYLGICWYEYYADQITGREKIMTEYNFS